MKTLTSGLALALALLAANVSAQTLADYQALVLSQGPSNYFKLDGSLESAVNSGVVLETNGLIVANGGFTGDVYRNSTHAYFFDAGQSSAYLRNLTDPLISGGGAANSNATATGSITFLFRALNGPNVGGMRYIFDATTTGNMGTTNHNALSLFFENDTSTNDPLTLKLRFGDVTATILQTNEIKYGSWYYFALTYDEARVPNKAIWYLGPAGGALSTGMTTNAADAVAGEGTGLYIGQRASFGGAFRNPGSGRVDEFAIWSRELTFLEISNQFARLPQPAPPGSTYQQVVTAQIPKYHFKLDNSLVESVGGLLVLSNNATGGFFTNDFLGNANAAYAFSETNDALYVTNDLVNGGGPTVNTLANGVGTISFQFRMLSDTNYGQRFLFSAPAVEATTTDDNQLALFLESSSTTTSPFPGSLKLRVGGTTKGNTNSTSADNNVPVAYATNLVPNAWYYFAMTYDESRNTPEVNVYFGQVGGPLSVDTMNPANSSVAGDNGWFVIGNKIEFGTITNSAFQSPGEGVIDEFAIWHDELTPAEIRAQFAAMTPVLARPSLKIELLSGNAVISWPASTPVSFVLETTNVLDSTTITAPIWPSAGSPAMVGTNFVVTNAVSSPSGFYRLRQP